MSDRDETTLSIKYVGRRFDEARLPLDVLNDLPALRDLIAALAKHEYRQNNPDRKRVPQGFDKSISFSLIEVKNGSAMPIIALDKDIAQQSLPNIGDAMSDIVTKAFEKIAKIYDDTDKDKYPSALPLDAIRALSKLGAGIQDNEHIEFTGMTGESGNVICLDSFRRKKLLTYVRETYTVEFEGTGLLTAIDLSNNSINVATEKYGEIRLILDPNTIPAVEFDGNLNTLIEFSISVELDANDSFHSVSAVSSVDLIQPYDEDIRNCVKRLQSLAQMNRGWLGEDHGEQLVHLAAMKAIQLIFMRADLASLFKIYPTEDGGVSIEFDKSKWSFAVEILPDGTLEIDGSSEDGETFEAKEFKEFSDEFFVSFDSMIAVASNDKD